MEECKMNKEQTEEQVQDYLHDDGGNGNGYHSFKETAADKTLLWITLAALAAGFGILLFTL